MSREPAPQTHRQPDQGQMAAHVGCWQPGHRSLDSSSSWAFLERRQTSQNWRILLPINSHLYDWRLFSRLLLTRESVLRTFCDCSLLRLGDPRCCGFGSYNIFQHNQNSWKPWFSNCQPKWANMWIEYDRVWHQGYISRQWDFMVKNVKLSSCQVVKLSDCQVVRLSSCQVVRLSSLILGACWTTSVLMSMLRSQCLLVKMVMVFWGPQQQHTPDPLTLEFIELAGSQLKPIVQM